MDILEGQRLEASDEFETGGDRVEKRLSADGLPEVANRVQNITGLDIALVGGGVLVVASIEYILAMREALRQKENQYAQEIMRLLTGYRHMNSSGQEYIVHTVTRNIDSKGFTFFFESVDKTESWLVEISYTIDTAIGENGIGILEKAELDLTDILDEVFEDPIQNGAIDRDTKEHGGGDDIL